MSEEKKEKAQKAEEKKAVGPKLEKSPAPEKKGPPTIAESEVAEHQAAASGNYAKEIQRRMQLDPDKSEAEVKKEYDKQLAEQAKIDKGEHKSAAHSSGPGKSVDKQ